MINKKIFKNNLNAKEYSNCIYMLHEEIKNILITKVRKFDKKYVYLDLCNLKNKCLTFFNEEQKLLVLEFYDLSFNQYNETFELDRLLDIYKTLKDS